MPNSRYKYTKKIKRGKKTVRKPTLYPKIPLRDDDIYIFSRESDKLEHLSVAGLALSNPQVAPLEHPPEA